MKHRHQGQILLITILVLTILSIIVVGIVGLARKDVTQTVATREYGRLLGVSEDRLLEFVPLYAKGDLSALLTAYPSNCTQIFTTQFSCKFTSGTTVTELKIEDVTQVVDYEVAKDQTLHLDMNNFRGTVSFHWEGEAALEFALLYRDGTQITQIMDLFDVNAIFDSSGNPPLTDTPPENHAFPFISDPVNGSGWYQFSIGSITGLPLTAQPLSLRITSRQRSSAGVVIKLDIDGSAGMPRQMRVFTAASYDPNTDTNVIARSTAQIPLYTQAVSGLNYALGVEGAVSK